MLGGSFSQRCCSPGWCPEGLGGMRSSFSLSSRGCPHYHGDARAGQTREADRDPSRSSTCSSSSSSRPHRHHGLQGGCTLQTAFPNAFFLQPLTSRWIQPDLLHTWQPNEMVSLATIMKARGKKKDLFSVSRDFSSSGNAGREVEKLQASALNYCL